MALSIPEEHKAVYGAGKRKYKELFSVNIKKKIK